MQIVPWLLGLGFIFQSYSDPFTDAETHIAQVGSDRGPALAIECGDETGGELRVRVTPGFQLYNSGVPGRYSDRYRFDDDQPVTYRVYYRGENAYLAGKEAHDFVRRLSNAETLNFEVTDWESAARMNTVRVNAPNGAIDRDMEKCAR